MSIEDNIKTTEEHLFLFTLLHLSLTSLFCRK